MKPINDEALDLRTINGESDVDSLENSNNEMLEESGSSGCGSDDQEDDESNEGSSEGSGSEQNDDGYVTTGVENLVEREDGNLVVKLLWNSGYSDKNPLSYLDIHVENKSPIQIVSNSLKAAWSKHYEVSITGSLSYQKANIILDIRFSATYEIPEMYRHH